MWAREAGLLATEQAATVALTDTLRAADTATLEIAGTNFFLIS